MNENYNVDGVWHCGDDILCPVGTKVFSPIDGMIIGGSPSGWDSPRYDYSGKRRNFGLKIWFEQPNGLKGIVILGHLSRPSENNSSLSDDQIRKFRAGENVKSGDFLGEIGPWSGGNHLHLGVAVTDKQIYTGLGRQPLPRPEMFNVENAIACGIWRDPIPYLTNIFKPKSLTIDYSMPHFDPSCKWIYFVRNNPAIPAEQLVRIDRETKKQQAIWQVDAGWRVNEYAVLRTVVVIKIENNQGYYKLLRIINGEASPIIISNSDFIFSRATQVDGEEFIAVFYDESQPTFAISLTDWICKPIHDLLYEENKFSFFSPPPPAWRMLGSRQNPDNQLSQIFLITGDADGENRGWVESNFECFNCLVLQDKESRFVENNQKEEIVFNKLINGKWIISLGVLEPIDGDVFKKGYKFLSSRDLSVSQPESNIFISDFDAVSAKLLVTVGDMGNRVIAFLDIDGTNLELIPL